MGNIHLVACCSVQYPGGRRRCANVHKRSFKLTGAPTKAPAAKIDTAV
jgi:hypothetical protein